MGVVLQGAAAVGEGLTVTISFGWIYTIAGSCLGAVVWALFKSAWPSLKSHLGAVRRLRRAEIALSPDSPGMWLAPSIPPSPPLDYQRRIERSIPIIVVANLKGGVGKTTSVANLIGHFGRKKGKRILALDLDFQGSLSVVVLSEADYQQSLAEQQDGTPSKAAQLIEGRDATWVRNVSNAVNEVPGARCIPSYYSLSAAENRIMIEWLIGKRTDDVRYNLARALHEPGIQDNFDLIFIDAPPRLTTGAVQALCAATHVLVPTVLDGMSAEATGGFIAQLAENRSIWPHLKLLGVFGNMTVNNTSDAMGQVIDGRLKVFEADAKQALVDIMTLALNDAGPNLQVCRDEPVFPENCFIPQKAELGREAGEGIAYQAQGGSGAIQDLSRAFDRLGDEIERRILATTRK